MRLCRFIFACLLAAFLSAPAVADSVADLYKTRCQGCHSSDGRASGIGKKLGAKDFQDPEVAKMSEAELVKIIGNGKNKMPPYKGKLTDDEIKALAKYIKEMR